MAIGEESETIESLAEPFLVRMGFISRTPRGRVATPAGFEHLGMKAPIGAPNLVQNQIGLFDTPASDA
jgi:Holliday junction DNA helicase RuvB